MLGSFGIGHVVELVPGLSITTPGMAHLGLSSGLAGLGPTCHGWWNGSQHAVPRVCVAGSEQDQCWGLQGCHKALPSSMFPAPEPSAGDPRGLQGWASVWWDD